VRIRALLLADAAQLDPRGKLHVLGLGWTHISSPGPPMAIVAIAELEPAEVPATFDIRFELLDAEQQPLTLPQDSEPLVIRGEGATEPIAVWAREEPTVAPLVVALGPGLPLEPGPHYFRATWTLGSGQTATELIRFHVNAPDQNEPNQPSRPA
jgi:hypothetical protein